jgi:hypothetical protein
MFRIVAFFTLLAFAWVMFSGDSSLDPNPATEVELSFLLTHPDLFEGKSITVSGLVYERASLLGYGGLYLRDAAGRSLLVLSDMTQAAHNSVVTASSL